MNRLFEKYPWLTNRNFLAGLYLLLVLGVTIQRMMLGAASYNNYLIFRWSFINLVDHVDLYSLHPSQHFDLFKYSPTFAFLMAPFSLFPDWLGIFLWNLVNAGVLFWAVNKLSVDGKARAFVLLFVAFDLLGALQNSQSNVLMAGLMIGAFAMFEKEKPVAAALLICLGFYVKLFAAVVGLLFLFYNKKGKFLIACVVWGILLGILPALVSGFDGLILQYKSWLHLLANDPAHELNYSLMTLTQRWFHFTAPDSVYLVPGILLLLLPLARRREWNHFNFRLVYLASMLVWVVIFNHKAESPTFIVATCGVALWGISEAKSWKQTALLWFVFLFTSLSATDLFPPYVREHFIKPYCIKALPCIVLWFVMIFELLRKRYTRDQRIGATVEKVESV